MCHTHLIICPTNQTYRGLYTIAHLLSLSVVSKRPNKRHVNVERERLNTWWMDVFAQAHTPLLRVMVSSDAIWLYLRVWATITRSYIANRQKDVGASAHFCYIFIFMSAARISCFNIAIWGDGIGRRYRRRLSTEAIAGEKASIILRHLALGLMGRARTKYWRI